MSRQNLNSRSLQRLSHILTRWPSDAVRPASVSVQNYLQSRLPKTSTNESSQPQSTPAPRAEISESSVNALSALLENRFLKAYPMSPKVRFPASDPEHYDKVVREFEEAPNRDWLGRLKKRLGGLFRL